MPATASFNDLGRQMIPDKNGKIIFQQPVRGDSLVPLPNYAASTRPRWWAMGWPQIEGLRDQAECD
jgi:hypothetical protein